MSPPGWLLWNQFSGVDRRMRKRHLLENIQKSFWVVKVKFGYFFKSVRGTPLSYHESRPDGTGSWGLDAGCSRRAATEIVVGQAMLADRWIGGQKSGLEKEDTKEERKGERREKKTEGERGKTFFWRGRRRISQVWLSLTLSYLIFEDHLTFLVDI